MTELDDNTEEIYPANELADGSLIDLGDIENTSALLALAIAG